MADEKDYSKEFSEKGFWDKLASYAKSAGKDVVEKALWMFYAFQDANTPVWAKTTIIGALGYFISPLDAIPDVVPVVGFADDLGAICAAIALVGVYITPDMRERAKNKIGEWFGD